VEVERLILSLLNADWLKQDTGTPGTLATEVERILAAYKVKVENSEVLALMAAHGFEGCNSDVTAHATEVVNAWLSKTPENKPLAFDAKTLNSVDWNKSDVEMDAALNKEFDGVPAVFLTHVKQIEA
jgi:hypothetical protein